MKAHLLACFFLVVGIFAFGLNLHLLPLWADEPIRALVSFHMLLDHNWLNPHLNGLPYLNKPPLYNWLLALFIKIFGTKEWVIRLPSYIAILGFSAQLYFLGLKIYQNKVKAILLGASLLISGNFLVFSSLLGHIDIPFSWLVFNQIYWSFYFLKRKKYRQIFAFSYLFCGIGFMMKGLPSLVFQSISLFTLFFGGKQFKKIFKPEHFLFFGLFTLAIIGYFWFFSLNGSLVDLMHVLFKESSQRTMVNKTLWQTIKHLVEFPFKILVDFLPSIFLTFFFFGKKFRHKFRTSDHALLAWVALFNLFPYWLSPDYRARYVFALLPLLCIPIIEAMDLSLFRSRILKKALFTLLIIVFFLLLCGSLGHPVYSMNPVNYQIALLMMLIFWGSYLYYFRNGHVLMDLVMFFLMGKLFLNVFALPLRKSHISMPNEKLLAKRIAEITKNKELEMMNCNIELSMNWYITTLRNQPTKTRTENFDTVRFYIVPEDIIRYPEDVTYYLRFVRKFENKKMALVKFKKLRHKQSKVVENENEEPRYYLNQ